MLNLVKNLIHSMLDHVVYPHLAMETNEDSYPTSSKRPHSRHYATGCCHDPDNLQQCLYSHCLLAQNSYFLYSLPSNLSLFACCCLACFQTITIEYKRHYYQSICVTNPSRTQEIVNVILQLRFSEGGFDWCFLIHDSQQITQYLAEPISDKL